jgi:prepilin-type N-terminal cleavage/methylation domain-containing protein
MQKLFVSQKGFTLIEVILAITILSTLSILSTQAISRALKARVKIQAEVDDVSSLRDSMRMMRADLNLAYHHRDFEQEISDLVAKAQKATPPGTPNPNNPAQNPNQEQSTKRKTLRGDPTTQFVGDNDQVHFVTMNNGRMTSTQVQADFTEVGYSLKDCKNLTTQKSSKCLYRRIQSILDDDVTTGGTEIVMLENITEFKIRYIGADKQDWVNAWKSTKESNDEETKGKYPDSVEVSIKIEREIDSKKRTYSMQYVIPIHFPNNSDKAPSSSSTNPSDGSQPSSPGGILEGGG